MHFSVRAYEAILPRAPTGRLAGQRLSSSTIATRLPERCLRLLDDFPPLAPYDPAAGQYGYATTGDSSAVTRVVLEEVL